MTFIDTDRGLVASEISYLLNELNKTQWNPCRLAGNLIEGFTFTATQDTDLFEFGSITENVRYVEYIMTSQATGFYYAVRAIPVSVWKGSEWVFPIPDIYRVYRAVTSDQKIIWDATGDYALAK